MKTLNACWGKAMLLSGAMLTLLGCSNTNEPAISKGQAEFQITDSPSDDASVKSVFVTVVDVKVDGQSVSGFTKQTIDLKAYQDGNTTILGTTQLDAKSYGSVSLLLDTDTDVNGNTPGCYVQTTDNAKYKLRSSGTVLITVNKTWSVTANSKSAIVLDFDLRKSIQAMADQSVRYNFVSNDNLQAAVRLTSKDKAGMVNGSYSEQVATNADKIVVYAYAKGSFNSATETQSQGDDAILFRNSVTSTEVKSGLSAKTYTLAFLDAGDYEIHFASYTKDAGTGRFVLQGLLKTQTSTTGADMVTVQSGISASVSTVIVGLL